MMWNGCTGVKTPEPHGLGWRFAAPSCVLAKKVARGGPASPPAERPGLPARHQSKALKP